jgi:hypothetical protein
VAGLHAKRVNPTIDTELRQLRERADEDFAQPSADRPPGRHQLDLAELGLRVSVTRSRYPNRPDGVDQYAVTLSRPALDRPPDDNEARIVLATAFGDAAADAVERSGPRSPVRMFRVPASE